MSPRDKTRAHMHKLVAFAALAAGCSKKHDPGYGVVDPMPPPAVCPGTGPKVKASARFVASDVLLELDFAGTSSKPGGGDASSYDGVIVAKELVGDTLRLRIARRSADATMLGVAVPVLCPGAGVLEVMLAWTRAPALGPDGGAKDAGLGEGLAPSPFPVTVQLYDR